MHIYPLFIFDVNVSSIVKKIFHCVPIAFSSCNVQRCPLTERKRALRH